eukprot:s2812_g4.t1
MPPVEGQIVHIGRGEWLEEKQPRPAPRGSTLSTLTHAATSVWVSDTKAEEGREYREVKKEVKREWQEEPPHSKARWEPGVREPGFLSGQEATRRSAQQRKPRAEERRRATAAQAQATHQESGQRPGSARGERTRNALGSSGTARALGLAEGR